MVGILDKSLPKVAVNLLNKLGATPIFIDSITYSYDLSTGETTSVVQSTETKGYVSRPTYQEIAGSAGLVTDQNYKVLLPCLNLPLVKVKDQLRFNNFTFDVIKSEVINSGVLPALQIIFVKENAQN